MQLRKVHSSNEKWLTFVDGRSICTGNVRGRFDGRRSPFVLIVVTNAISILKCKGSIIETLFPKSRVALLHNSFRSIGYRKLKLSTISRNLLIRQIEKSISSLLSQKQRLCERTLLWNTSDD